MPSVNSYSVNQRHSIDHIILTGATGYLGSAILARLCDSTVFKKVTATYHRNIPQKHNVTNLNYVSYDALIDGTFNLEGVDLICHLGMPRVDRNVPALAQSVRDFGCLLQRSVAAGVREIFLASSQAVYGLATPLWNEVIKPEPVTAYGLCKIANEELLRLSANFCPQLRTICVRLPKLIGPGYGFRANQGEWVHGFILGAIRSQKITLEEEFFKQTFDFLDVRDAADLVTQILCTSPESWPSTLNLGRGRTFQGDELLEVVCDFWRSKHGNSPEIVIRKSISTPRSFGMSNQAMLDYLGDVSLRSLQTTVSDVYDWVLGRYPYEDNVD